MGRGGQRKSRHGRDRNDRIKASCHVLFSLAKGIAAAGRAHRGSLAEIARDRPECLRLLRVRQRVKSVVAAIMDGLPISNPRVIVPLVMPG
jgi:hypothetical protein